MFLEFFFCLLALHPAHLRTHPDFTQRLSCHNVSSAKRKKGKIPTKKQGHSLTLANYTQRAQKNSLSHDLGDGV